MRPWRRRYTILRPCAIGRPRFMNHVEYRGDWAKKAKDAEEDRRINWRYRQQLSGGTLLALGLFTRPACLLLVFTMVQAGRIGHRNAGYLITNDPPGAEYTINLAAICGVFLLTGPGRVSLDALVF